MMPLTLKRPTDSLVDGTQQRSNSKPFLFRVVSFIHSFIQAISIVPFQVHLRRPRHNTDTAPEFHAEVPQATMSEGLAQGPYLVARVGVETMNLRTKGVDSTNVPPTPHNYLMYIAFLILSRILLHQDNSFADCCVELRSLMYVV